jgi:hypothetical protein
MNLPKPDAVEFVTLRRTTPRAVAQILSRHVRTTPFVPPMLRGRVVTAQQPPPGKAQRRGVQT